MRTGLRYALFVTFAIGMLAIGAGRLALPMQAAQTPTPDAVLNAFTVSQQARLTRPLGGGSIDSFGIAVDIDGDTAVVGAYNADIGETSLQGTAYVFTRTDDTWSLQQQLLASDGGAFERFGQAVAIEGDTVMIGASSADQFEGVRPGGVYVFTRTNNTWSEQQKLGASDGVDRDFFGSEIALQGDTLVVGAPSTDVTNPNLPGAAYVFTRSNSTWSQQQKLVPNVGSPNDRFGDSVAVDGNTIAVGAAGVTVGENSLQGAVYVFTRSGSSWSQQQQLITSDGAEGDRFGVAVAVQGDTVFGAATGGTVVGSAIPGAVYVFSRSGEAWTQQQKLAGSPAQIRDFFGETLAVEGDTLAIGALGTDQLQGVAYLYVRQGGMWLFQNRIVSDDIATGDTFGASVALSGSTLIAGAYSVQLGQGSSQGAAYVFTIRRTVYLPLVVRGN